MISRVAESCFWMNRYVERIENTARMLRVHRSFILDVDLDRMDSWRPVIVVSGEEERFLDKYDQNALSDDEAVQEYLTWDEECPVSIMSSLRWARENARTMREVISVDMWEALNDFWLWMQRGPGRREYRSDRDEFYLHVRDWPHAFYGISHASLMHDEAFDFMRLGMLIERCGQTARLLDVKHHMLTSVSETDNPAIESASWLVLLRTCSAMEPFYKRHQEATTAQNVAAFLLLEMDFPRSIKHCVDRAYNFLGRVRAETGRGDASSQILRQLRSRLDSADVDDILSDGLHDELTNIVVTIARLCSAVHADFFDTSLSSHAA